MAGAFDEIAAAVPLFALRWIGAEAGIVEIEELPQTHGAADGEGKGEGVRVRFAFDRRHGAQERREIGDILRGHALIGGVGEGRVEVLAIRGNARQERVGDIDRAPGANPVDRIGRDVRRVERPERGLEFEPPAKFQSIVLAGRLVARFAAAGVKNKPPSGGVAGQAKGLPFLSRIARSRRRQRPCQRGPGGDDHRKDGGNPLHPRGRVHIRARANSSLSRFWPYRVRDSRRSS